MNYTDLKLQTKHLSLPTVDTRIVKIRPHKDPEISFSDFVINGQSVGDVMRAADPQAPLVATLLQDHIAPKYQLEYLDRLLNQREPDLPSGRVALYLCPFDADLQCDTVACRVEFRDDRVIWRDFAWDGISDEDEVNTSVPDEEDATSVRGLTDYVFDRSYYERLLKQKRHELESIK